MKKRVLSLFLVLAMLLSLVTVTTATVTAAETATPSPVTKVDQPAHVSVAVGATVEIDGVTYTGINDLSELSVAGNYILTGDITVSASANVNTGTAPNGYDSSNDSYAIYGVAAGTQLHGNGYSIIDATTGDVEFASLFALWYGDGSTIVFSNLLIKDATVNECVFFVNPNTVAIFDNVDVDGCSINLRGFTAKNTVTNNAIGIFDSIIDGTVTIRNCDVSGTVGKDGVKYNAGTATNAWGSFVGYVKSGSVTIENCTNTATMLNGDVTIGGFVGEVNGGVCMIQNSLSNLSGMTGGTRIGGFMGKTSGGTTTIENCTNQSNMTAMSNTCSGFIADVAGGVANITNCINEGSVSTASSSATDYKYRGGFVGRITSSGTANITGCINKGTITSEDATGNGSQGIGGIVGYMNNTSTASLTNCVNEGRVQSAHSYIGGIFGWMNGSGACTITGCVNYGTVKSTLSDSAVAGGIIGNCNGNQGGSNTGKEILVSKCFNYGAIEAVEMAGGITGGCSGYGSHWRVSECVNYGTVTTDNSSGGIAGQLGGNANSKGTIEKCVNYGTLTSKGNIGGIVGEGSPSAAAKVTQCLNAGTLVKTDSGDSVGGIYGYLGTVNLTISDCVDIGVMTFSDTSYTNGRLGGILGGGTYDHDGDSTTAKIAIPVVINNCHSYATIPSCSINLSGTIYGEANLTTDDKCTYLSTLNKLTANGSSTSVDAATAASTLNNLVLENTGTEAEPTWVNWSGLYFTADADGSIDIANPQLVAVQETGTGTVRFIMGIENYEIYDNSKTSLNVTVTVNGKSHTESCHYVYTQIIGDGETYTPSDFGSNYLYALTIDGVPTSGTIVFTVTPSAVIGGTTYTGGSYEVTYTDGEYISAVRVAA